MKNKFLISLLLLFFYLNHSNNVLANDFTFNTSGIEIIEDGNIIKATDGTVISNKSNISIKAQNFKYIKNLSTLNATKGIAKSLDDNLEIKANKFLYNSDLSILNAFGNVQIKDLKENVVIKSENIFYNINKKIIQSETDSSIKDDQGNTFTTKNFIYTLNDYLIKIDSAKIIDAEKNVFKIDKAYLNLESNKLIGKDISIDFNNSSFNQKNEPRVKGVALSASKEESVISKGVFTICKKNDTCPPWQLSAEEIRHNKEKKTIYYKNAWLKLYDKPVFYFPKFFHPDPTVKRQSGFLMPAFQDSASLGASLNIPYYKVISDNKDLTLRPRFYADSKLLLQNEFRMVDSKSKHTIDTSILSEAGKNNKAHFFSQSVASLNFSNFDESELKLEFQQTTNDTYLKTYKMKSPIINDTNVLKSSLIIDAYREDLSFSAELYAYEDLSKRKSDRYEFIYPSYNLSKHLSDTNFLLNSSGYIKNYDTNIFEKVLINDLIFNSDKKFTNNGFKNNYNFLIKNINTDGTNSKKYKQKRDHKLASLIELNSSYPLIKEKEKYTSVLKPLVSLKYSPNNSKNMRDEDRRIDSNNIFSFNRIGSSDSVEGGASFTYGAEFLRINQNDEEIFGLKIANIFRPKEDENLPSISKMGSKTSDFVGNIKYRPNDFFNTNYNFSIDNNMTDTNYQLINAEVKINNFITSFEYLNENSTIESQSYLSNKTSYIINNANKFIYEARQNKKKNITEFYNLIYQYQNDCLIAAIEYNKDYYDDGDLKPEENIFFKLTIIPFGETSTPSLKK